jgi:hypothetical protein
MILNGVVIAFELGGSHYILKDINNGGEKVIT